MTAAADAGRPTWGGQPLTRLDEEVIVGAAAIVAEAIEDGVDGHRAGDLQHVLEAAGVLAWAARVAEDQALIEARRPGGPELSWGAIAAAAGHLTRSTTQRRHARALRTVTSTTGPRATRGLRRYLNPRPAPEAS